MTRFGEQSSVYRSTNVLISTGPYAFTRNPMYLSLTLLSAGIGVIVNTAWPVILLSAVLMVVPMGSSGGRNAILSANLEMSTGSTGPESGAGFRAGLY